MQTNMRLKFNVKDAKLYVFPQNLVNVTGSDVIFGTTPVSQSHLKIDLSRFVPFLFSLRNFSKPEGVFCCFDSASKLSSLTLLRSKRWSSLRKPSKSKNIALERALSRKVICSLLKLFFARILIEILRWVLPRAFLRPTREHARVRCQEGEGVTAA